MADISDPICRGPRERVRNWSTDWSSIPLTDSSAISIYWQHRISLKTTPVENVIQRTATVVKFLSSHHQRTISRVETTPTMLAGLMPRGGGDFWLRGSDSEVKFANVCSRSGDGGRNNYSAWKTTVGRNYSAWKTTAAEDERRAVSAPRSSGLGEGESSRLQGVVEGSRGQEILIFSGRFSRPRPKSQDFPDLRICPRICEVRAGDEEDHDRTGSLKLSRIFFRVSIVFCTWITRGRSVRAGGFCIFDQVCICRSRL